jgi:hypothetical protein
MNRRSAWVGVSSSGTPFFHIAVGPSLPRLLLMASLHRCLHSTPIGSSGAEGFCPKTFCHLTCSWSTQTTIHRIIWHWRLVHPMLKTSLHLIVVAILNCTNPFIFGTVGSSDALLDASTCPTYLSCHLDTSKIFSLVFHHNLASWQWFGHLDYEWLHPWNLEILQT